MDGDHVCLFNEIDCTFNNFKVKCIFYIMINFSQTRAFTAFKRECESQQSPDLLLFIVAISGMSYFDILSVNQIYETIILNQGQQSQLQIFLIQYHWGLR